MEGMRETDGREGRQMEKRAAEGGQAVRGGNREKEIKEG